MRITLISTLIVLLILGCKNENNKKIFLVDDIPDYRPIDFKKELVPNDKIIHRGIFSPRMDEYYFTISDKDYTNFDVLVIKKKKGKWTEPQEAFFNSEYNEHGMSFSPDGKVLYFSSTRPSTIDKVPETWHIWKSEQLNGTWSKPEFVDIPNLRGKLVSHPSVAKSGTIYFHVSNLDYSNMDIYYSKQINGKYQYAVKSKISMDLKTDKGTPHISADEDYLLFASIGNQLDLMICFNNGNGEWTNTKKLDTAVNSYGQGNPYVTPDNNFLFFATGKDLEDWSIKWVRFKPELLNN